MDKNTVIKQLAKKYDLVVSQAFKFNTTKDLVDRKYWFENSPDTLEKLFSDEDFKKLNMKPQTMAYLLFCYLNIRYSQENEFFID